MSVRITFEIPDDVYRALLPLMSARNITAKQIAQHHFSALAHRVTAGELSLRPRPRMSVPPRPPAVDRSRNEELSHEEQQRLQHLHVELKLRANMIADLMGISAQTVQRYVVLLDLPRHPRGTAPYEVNVTYQRLREGAAA